MDPACTAVLAGVGYFIHLCAPLFHRAFYSFLIGMGSSLGYAVHQKETKGLIFSFHDTVAVITLGAFAVNTGTKLVNKQSNSNTFQEPENNGIYKARKLWFI
ncbi:MAG: hypothetical protein ABIR78_02495 [Ferruginibacter sp.]